MKPEHEDPNNHVPKVSDDDDWDDLDSDSSPSESQLPPRRADFGIPPKKESKRSNVRLHEPRLKLGTEGPRPASPKDDEVGEPGVGNPGDPSGAEAAGARKAAKKTVKKGAKKAARKAAGKSAKKKSAGSAKSHPSESDAAEVGAEAGHPDEDGSDAGTRLAVVPARKPGNMRINTIGSDESLDSVRRIPKMAPAATGEKSARADGKQRRRFVSGERSDWGENGGRGSLMWILGSGLGTVLIVILAVFLTNRGKKDNEVVRDLEIPMDELSAKVSEAETAGVAALDRLSGSEEEARELYDRFKTATTPEELSGVLYNAEENLALAAEHLTPSATGEAPDSGASPVWKAIQDEGMNYGLLEGVGSGFEGFTAVFRFEDEALKLDWRATSGYGTASFDELRSGEGDASEIRGRLSPTDFYTYPFPEEDYTSFRLLPPGDGRPIWVYAERGGELDERLRKLFTPSQITGEVRSEMRVVLSLERGPGESLPNQWIISGIHGINWLENER